MIVGNIMRRRLPYFTSLRGFGSTQSPAEATEAKAVEPNFLEMVESYFDKAAKHTKIPQDRLNLYKKSECVIKFHLTLKRGSH
jgi:glutamate dehydrogenase (NAD(P)+)